MTPVVSLRGVVRTFKEVRAVDGIDLDLEPGRIYGLLGPNGSGKTTSLKMMTGLTLPDRGEISLFGAPPDDAGRARIGYVPETRALVDTAIVRELLTFYGRMRGMSSADASHAADTWIDKLDLGEKADARVKTLSNGQQQKVQIALALLSEPELILLDEPLTGLDPTHQDLVSRHVREAAAQGACVLLSTHRLREAEVFVDSVVMLASGRKVLDARLDEAKRQGFDGTWEIRLPAGASTAWIDGPGVLSTTDLGDGRLEVRLADPEQPGSLLARAAAAQAPLLGARALLPDLHDLYRITVGRTIDADGEVAA